ncbi:hypothetical protein ACWGB8_34355 [Kitasatospora sp. NPDC054939]
MPAVVVTAGEERLVDIAARQPNGDPDLTRGATVDTVTATRPESPPDPLATGSGPALTPPTHPERWSDHAPVTVHYDRNF